MKYDGLSMDTNHTMQESRAGVAVDNELVTRETDLPHLVASHKLVGMPFKEAWRVELGALSA